MHKNLLFENRREIWLFLAFCAFVLLLNLAFKFYEFNKFKSEKYLVLNVKVAQSYLKTSERGKTKRILKLRAKNFSFYTTTKAEFEPAINSRILIRPIQNNVKFVDFLSQSFYMPNFGALELRNASQSDGLEKFRDKFYEFIANQHDLAKPRELFTALFLATPISKELRDDVNHFGIAHLISISGYHLGLIFAVLYFCLRLPYGYFQRRYFPYRNEKFDISIAIFIFLFGYLVTIGFVPSFLRAFLMSLLVFYLFSRNINIVSFEILAVIIVLALSFMPNLAFRLGFYFSCAGVFFIYLYLHHFKDKFSNLTHVILLNLWVYLAMIVPVLYFFPLISFQQFAVLPLSFSFVVFYPMSVILHALNLGGMFDEG
ncbi:ComEC/Rec2 family competence protein, partial [Campylobacter sp.]|uniref:ComEC/Rec2 family competence protein n=1 Tax=Campylobacter sp. TaxID=205 RepID=UPI00270C326A|nr:ComEC/Rec2 family competence protein [Campylobacter sp.]